MTDLLLYCLMRLEGPSRAGEYRNAMELAPGPVEMRADALAAGAFQPRYFRTDRFSEWMLALKAKFLRLLGLPDSCEIVFLTGSGTAGMEAVAANFLPAPGVLSISCGQFGDRMAQIAERRHFAFDRWSFDPACAPQENLLGRSLGGYRLCLATIAETSNGYFLDPAVLRSAGLAPDCLLLCDAVTAAFVDDFDIDAADGLVIGSQKGLGLAPGMCFVILRERALDALATRSCDSFYFDFASYIGNMKRGQTPFTPALSVLYQLDNTLDTIAAEGGLSALVKRRASLAGVFRSQLERDGIDYTREYISNCVTVINTGAIDAEWVARELKDRFDITVATNSPPFKKNRFRVSHMGDVTDENMEHAARAVAAAMRGRQ